MRSLHPHPQRVTLAAVLALPLALAGCGDDDGVTPPPERPSPGPADFTDLVLSAGTLSPAFSFGTTFYTVAGILLPPAVTVTPFAADPAATITVDGVPVASGTPSSPVTLALGMNTITVVVTAADGVTLNGYMVLVFRGPEGQQGYLKASNTEASDLFGCAVAVDRDTVVVGAWPEHSNETGTTGTGTDNSAPAAGAAYVFVRSGGVWQQEAYLKAHNTDMDDWFGHAVAVDGDTVVVGAYREDSNETGTSGAGADDSAGGERRGVCVRPKRRRLAGGGLPQGVQHGCG